MPLFTPDTVWYGGRYVIGDNVMHHRHARGFTLIELLVVIAVIAMLVSILMPALAKARLHAMRASCSINHRNIGLTMTMYREDFNDQVPISITSGATPSHTFGSRNIKTWRQMLYEFNPAGGFSLFDCPASKQKLRVEAEVDDQNAGSIGVMMLHSWALFRVYSRPDDDYRCDGPYPVRNYWIDETWPVNNGMGWHSPRNSMYCADAYQAGPNPFQYPSIEADWGTNTIAWIYSPPVLGTIYGDRRSFADRHIGTNILFFDNSVRLYRTQTLEQMVPGDPENIWDVN